MLNSHINRILKYQISNIKHNNLVNMIFRSMHLKRTVMNLF